MNRTSHIIVSARSLQIYSAAFVSVLALAFQGCGSGGSSGGGFGGGSSGHQECQTSFSTTVNQDPAWVYIDDAQHRHFNSGDLAFLNNPNYVVTTMYFQMNLQGQYYGNDGEVLLSVNGVRAYDASPTSAYGCNGYWGSDNHSDCNFEMDKMAVNGALPAQAGFSQILNNHGEIEMEIQGNGRSCAMNSATLVVSGYDYSPCVTPSPSPSPTHTTSPTPTTTSTPTPSPSPSPSPSPIPTPHTTITAENPATSPTNSTSMSISFTSDQVGVSFACSLDGAAAVACTSPVLYSGLANGNHSFKVAATNNVGETDPVGASYGWSVDTVPPNVTITNAASLPTTTNQTSITLDFTATDPGATVTYTCSLDNVSAGCASPATYTGLSAGQHQVSITATDSAGNTDTTPATFQWTVDLTPPVVSLNNVSPGGSPTNSTSIAFTFSANETSTFNCSIDSAPYATCTSPQSYNDLAAGQHTFSVEATDVAGNVSTPATYAWTIDLTPPVLSLGSVVPAAGLTNATMVSVEFTSSKPVTATCALDGVATDNCTSPFASPISQGGTHSVQISAIDQAGNASNVLTVDWTMDYTAPAISWGAMLPSAASYINTTTFQADITESEAVTLACTVNGSSIPQTASPISLSDLTEGTYDVQAVGTDAAGNVSNLLDHSFTVDLTAPVVSLSESISGLTNQTINDFTFSATAETSVSYQCELDGQGFSACQSPTAVSGLSDGAHTYQVEATDLAGNVSEPASVSWTVDTTPPVTTLTETRNSNTSITFTFVASEPASFQCTLDGGAATSCTSPVSYSLQAGNHVFTVQATDLAGNVEVSPPSYAWTVNPPISTTITSESVGSVTNQTGISIAFTSNTASATFQCTLDGSAPAACSSPYSTTGLAEGSHHFVVQAIDAWGAVDPTGASYSWTVDLTSPVTTLTETRTSNTSITFSFTATEASTFQCILDGGAATACVSPDSLSGLSVGSHTFSVQATDQAGNVEKSPPSYTWTVNPPIITTITSESVPAMTNQTSVSVSFTSNISGATFQCSLNGSAPASCSSPYTSSGLANGSQTFKVQAVDPWGAVDPTGASFSWAISTTPPVSTITANRTANAAISFSFTATESASFQCSFNGGAFAACTAPVSYTGLAAGNDSFTVKATDLYGNVEASPPSYLWTVYAPVSTSLTSESVGAYTNQTSFSASFTASIPGSTFQCSLNGSAPAACTSPYSTSGLANGSQTFKVQAIDPWGSVDATGASYSWTVETIPPTVSGFSDSVTTFSITVSWTTSTPATAGANWGLGTSTNHNVADNGTYTTSHSIMINGLSPNQTYSVTVTGHDQSGNVYSYGPVQIRTN